MKAGTEEGEKIRMVGEEGGNSGEGRCSIKNRWGR